MVRTRITSPQRLHVLISMISLGELVKDGVNGLVFRNAEQLASQLEVRSAFILARTPNSSSHSIGFTDILPYVTYTCSPACRFRHRFYDLAAKLESSDEAISSERCSDLILISVITLTPDVASFLTMSLHGYNYLLSEIHDADGYIHSVCTVQGLNMFSCCLLPQRSSSRSVLCLYTLSVEGR